MTLRNRFLGFLALLVFAIGAQASAAAITKCPSGGTPSPGSVVTGGLEVDDVCVLTDVTIYGGVVVDAVPPQPAPPQTAPFPLLELRSGQVYGGIVNNGGFVFLGFNGETGEPTNQPVTVDGGITLNRPLFDIFVGATIRGELRMNGSTSLASIFPDCGSDPFCFASDLLCGNNIYGSVSVTDVDSHQVIIGDPNEFFCSGNTIHGSVFMKDTNFTRLFDGEGGEIEGNRVTGSVHVDHSTAEVNENTVGGSLLCTNGTVIQPSRPPDQQGNTVRGKNTCDQP